MVPAAINLLDAVGDDVVFAAQALELSVALFCVHRICCRHCILGGAICGEQSVVDRHSLVVLVHLRHELCIHFCTVLCRRFLFQPCPDGVVHDLQLHLVLFGRTWPAPARFELLLLSPFVVSGLSCLVSLEGAIHVGDWVLQPLGLGL